MKQSAGILLYKKRGSEFLVLLVHPGGPFWKNKDEGAWSIPKGEFADEDPLQAAIREFEEETGNNVDGNFIPLEPVKIKSGKLIYAWALEHDLDTGSIHSNEFELEWPPGSGKMQSFPEIDKAEWFILAMAMKKINQGQSVILKQLSEILAVSQ